MLINDTCDKFVAVPTLNFFCIHASSSGVEFSSRCLGRQRGWMEGRLHVGLDLLMPLKTIHTDLLVHLYQHPCGWIISNKVCFSISWTAFTCLDHSHGFFRFHCRYIQCVSGSGLYSINHQFLMRLSEFLSLLN